jgi:hypothetical protein
MDEAEVNRIIEGAGAVPLTDGAIAKLRREHEAFWARHGAGGEKAHVGDFSHDLTYGHWYTAAKRRTPWKLCVATERPYSLQPAARDEVRRRTGHEDWFDYVTGFKGQYAAGDWILYVHQSIKSGIVCEWLRADFYVAVQADRRRSDCRYQAVQLSETSAEVSAPFLLDASFRKAMKGTLESHPDDDYSVHTSQPFLNQLHKKYIEAFRQERKDRATRA